MKHFLFFLLLVNLATAQSLRQRTVTLMGSRFDITIVATDDVAAEKYIDT
ncbi:MAG: FAD:protein FMN transferase, partial [Proteobacteria bacterium]